MKLSKLQLFLTFIKADEKYSSQLMGKGFPFGKLDFPLLRYTSSLDKRLQMLTMLLNYIHDLNENSKSEMKKAQENGYGTNEKGLILIIYYESFLNQIYSIMQNLAIINLFMFNANGSVSHKFSNQMNGINNIEEGKVYLHPQYDKLIKEKMEWYQEVHQIRSNTTHFMVGMNVFEQSDNEEWIPQYMNFSISNRLPDFDFTIKRNILKDADFFYNSTIEILNQISEIYIERMEKDKTCAVTFIEKDGIEFREISYNQFMSGEKGKLIQSTIRS